MTLVPRRTRFLLAAASALAVVMLATPGRAEDDARSGVVGASVADPLADDVDADGPAGILNPGGLRSSREDQELDWWQTAVIYQIYPRSFKDSDGDGIGDINGITEKAEYLKKLGITAVWLSPIFKSPMADFGYDISDFKDIDPIFGSLDDFDRLRDKLSELGIRLLLDFVPNHSSDQHPWFKKSVQREDPYTDYYVWADGRPDPTNPARRLPPNNWLSVFGGSAWKWNEHRGQFYLHQFATEQPDLNYTNPLVVTEMEDVLEFWLSRGVDGFRVDAVPFLLEDASLRDEEESDAPDALPTEHASLRHARTQNLPGTYALIARWRALLDRHSLADGRTRLMMVEAYAERDELMRYFGGVGGVVSGGDGSGGDSGSSDVSAAPGAHFPFNFALLSASKESTARDIKEAVHEWMDNMPAGGWPNWVLGNHDQSRIATRVGQGLVDGFNSLSLLLPGTAIVYNGEELGMEDGEVPWELTVDPQGRNAGPKRFQKFSRDPARTPFQWDDTSNAGFAPAGTQPWLPVRWSFRTVNARVQDDAPVSHLQVFRRLVELRQRPAVQRGALNVQTPSDTMLAFSRELTGNETLLVVINLSDESAVADLVTAFGGDLPDFLSVAVPSINSGLRISQQILAKEVKLPGKASVVLSTKQP